MERQSVRLFIRFKLTQDKYKSKIDWLFHQFPAFQKQGGMAYKPGLSHTQKLLNHFNLDITKLNAVHVAGTNGKGSACSFLASLLIESNQKVGLFISPHIFDFRERIRIDGVMITKTEVMEYIENIQALQLNFRPSFFEITFVLAVKHFLDQSCDYCIFETGMGGRLDATNVLQPTATAITNISLDHTEFLGNTLEAISKEKAGIIKMNTPLFIGKKEPHSFPIFESISKNKDAILHVNQNQYPFEGLPKYQKENFNLALNLFDFVSKRKSSPSNVEKALQNLEQNTGYSMRLECVSENPKLYLDVSHNDEGIQRTIEYVKNQTKGKLYIFFGGAKDKEYGDRTLEVLDTIGSNFCLFSNPRSKSKEDWEKVIKRLENEIPVFSNLGEAMCQIKPNMEEDDTLLITGSFFLISDYKPSFWQINRL